MMPRFKGKRVMESSVASFIILLILCYILYQMFQGFYLSIILGLVFAIFLRPLFLTITKYLGDNKGFGAFVTMALTAILILMPMGWLLTMLATEAIHLGASTNFTGVDKILNDIITATNSFSLQQFGLAELIQKAEIVSFIRSKSTFVGESLLGVLGNVLGLVTSAVIMLMTVFYALVEWESIKDYIFRYSPLTDRATRKMVKKVLIVIRAALKGYLIMIFVYATAATLGFTMFWVKIPLLLGALYGMASLIPVVGTGLVWIPTVAYLALTGNYIAATGLALWCSAIGAALDNIVMPSIVRNGSRLHPFLILIGVIGGISLFGLVGFIIGPTIIALTLVSIELFKGSPSRYKVKAGAK